ncbi:MAG TPA: cytochrome c-type biogenesis protein [Thermoleophilia bacterium]|nr:cytochrome c-type biogenesis protein [Thermoleophilia bacterium]
MFRTLALLVALAAFAVHGPAWMPPSAEAKESVEGMAGQLMCQCGCGLVVAACGGVMECAIGDKMKATIGRQLAEGKTRDEILDYFVTVYGEVVLAAPVKSGFNLSAWIIPFAAVGAGAIVLTWVLRAWAGRRRPEPVEAAPLSDDELLAYRKRVERELQEQPG